MLCNEILVHRKLVIVRASETQSQLRSNLTSSMVTRRLDLRLIGIQSRFAACLLCRTDCAGPCGPYAAPVVHEFLVAMIARAGVVPTTTKSTFLLVPSHSPFPVFWFKPFLKSLYRPGKKATEPTIIHIVSQAYRILNPSRAVVDTIMGDKFRSSLYTR